MSTPRAVFFDFGNVLIHWDVRPIFSRFFPNPEAVEAFLAEISFTEWNTHQDKGRSFAEGIALLSERFPHYASIFHYYNAHWPDSIRTPIPGTVAIARALKDVGHPIYLLTNSSDEKFPLARQVHPFLAMFDDAVISGAIGLLKPDPAIFHYALERIQRPAEECLFIDDHLPNVEAAQRLGFTAIHFRSPDQLQRHLRTVEGIQLRE